MSTDSIFRLAICAIIGGGLLLTIAPPSQAQGWDPAIDDPGVGRRLTLGVEVGHPLVAGFSAGYHFKPRYAAKVGFAALSGFTAWSGDARLNLLIPKLERPTPFLTGGFTQYFLQDGGEKTSPLAVQAALGVEYTFLSYFNWGATFGYMKSIGSSSNPDVERYGISDDVERATFTMSAGYMF